MRKLVAVLWDFDGTIVSSLRKNFSITKKIMAEVHEDYKTEAALPDPLKDFEEYKKVSSKAKNWRDLYMQHFNLTSEETTKAGNLWGTYQEKDQTPVEVFDGLADFINALSYVPHGICSQNSSKFISKKLEEDKIDQHFRKIIGYDDISYDQQKPNPNGFLSCIDQFPEKINSGIILYIGDHEQDVVFAKNAQIAFAKRGETDIEVISIAANYESCADLSHWAEKPNHTANEVSDLYAIAEKYSDAPVRIQKTTLKF